MKTVHWQLPFCSLKGTQYRIDIYADGASSAPVQLTGAATPFTTDEDNSDDFFAPVRTQTGSITVVDTTGTLMADLMPSDNIDRPVRLIRVSDGAILWQGFLSCEAYSQPYTSRPTEITIPVNSVLAAMQSVQLPLEQAYFVTVGTAIANMMVLMNDKESNILEYYLPLDSINVVSKYIDTTVLFDLKQQDNENSTTYTPVGISMYDALSRICAYMGWTLRESGNRLYFIDAANTSGYRRYYRQGVIQPDGTVVVSYVVEPMKSYPVTTSSVATFEYRGTGHQIEQRQGAKSVEVVANVAEYNLDMQLPECPVGNLQEKDTDVGLVLATPVDNFDNRIELQGIRARAKHYYMGDSSNTNEIYFRFAEMLPLADAFFHPQTKLNWKQGNLNNEFDQYYYAYFCKPIGLDFKNALAIQGVQGWRVKEDPRFAQWYMVHEFFEPTADMYLFKLKSLVRFVSTRGWLHLELIEENVKLIPDDMRIGVQYVTMSVCYADKWWNGTGWQTSFSTFKVNLNNDGTPVTNKTDTMKVSKDGGIFMQIDSFMEGTIELAIYHDVSLIAYDEYYQEYEDRNQAFFSSIKLEYLGVEDGRFSDRPANHYYRLLDLNFSEEVSVSTDLASDLNNRPSPSILMNSETEPMTTLHYADGTDERPERHLLDRLATYYGAARTRITLEADRPSEAPLPLTRLTGYDGKIYIPLSESMDWRADTSTILCFECPE